MLFNIQNIFLGLGLMTIASQAFAEVEFIDLYNRSPEEITPIIRNNFPHIPINQYGNQLVINGNSNENKQIKSMVTQLDTPARRLRITVDTGERSQSNQQNLNTRAHILLGNRNSVHGKASFEQRNTLGSGNSIKQVLTTEGYPALIQVGQRVPVNYTIPDRYGRPVVTTEYQDVMQSLYVSAQIVGQQVFINVSNQNDRLQHTGQINQQSINTRVSGQLGNWITIGSLQDNNNYNNQGLGHYSQGASLSNTEIKIKVDLAN